MQTDGPDPFTPPDGPGRWQSFRRGLALALASVCLGLAACAPQVEAPEAPPPPAEVPARIVGGARMDPAATIAANIALSRDHETLVAAMNAAGLSTRLAAAGSYTLFAPIDSSFDQLPRGTMEALMHPRSRVELAAVVNYHVVPGLKTRAQIEADIAYGRGSATYRTLQGATLRLSREGGAIAINDLNGRRARILDADVTSSNGLIHVVSNLLLPPPGY